MVLDLRKLTKAGNALSSKPTDYPISFIQVMQDEFELIAEGVGSKSDVLVIFETKAALLIKFMDNLMRAIRESPKKNKLVRLHDSIDGTIRSVKSHMKLVKSTSL